MSASADRINPVTKQTRVITGTPMDDVRWREILRQLAEGATRKAACKAAGVSLQTFRGYIVATDDAVAKIRHAELQWIRRDWPIERIEELFTQVAMGSTLKAASEELNLLPEEFNNLYRLILNDNEINQIYQECRHVQAESLLDEIIDISDDNKDDKTGNRVNHDVVHRAKLKINTRQWVMGRLNFRRFGDKQHLLQEVNVTVNHQETLDGARKRRELAHRKRKGDPAVIEGTAQRVD
jgi:hypothetical protein